MPKKPVGRPRTGRIKKAMTLRPDRVKYLNRKRKDGQTIGHVVDEALDLHEAAEKEGK